MTEPRAFGVEHVVCCENLVCSENIKGVASVIRYFTPAMIDRGTGVIVNFSSGWGRSTSPEVAPYCATKWAIEGLTGALSQELPAGLAAVALNPGVIDTDMQADLRQASPDEFADVHHFAQLKTAGRLATAEEAAKQVLQYLRRSDFGQSAVVDVREE